MGGSAVDAAAEDASRRTRWVLAWLALVPVAVLRAGVLVETDTFWQIRTGYLTMSLRAVPRVDSFSWTARGEVWTLNSWAFNVALAVADRVGGLPGVAVTCASLTLVGAGLVLFLAKRLGASAVVAATVLLVASPLLLAWFSARPQLVDYIAVLVLVLLLHRLVREPTVRVVLGVGLLSIIWVNLHAAAALGVGITGAVAVLLLIGRRTRPQGCWGLVATACAAAGCLVNPYGIGLVTQAAQVKSASADVVVEWQHLDPSDPQQVAMLAIGLVGLALSVRRRDPAFAGALLVATAGSVTAIRFLPILVLLALPLISAALSRPVVLRYLRSRRLVLVPCAVVGTAVLAVYAAPNLSHLGQPAPWLYPAAVVRDIPRGCHLFNTYKLGGFVMFERPDVAVSIDSRNDLYGMARVQRADRILDGQDDLVDGLRGADCVLVPPTSVLARRLRGDADWWLRSSEPTALLFLRSGSFPDQQRDPPGAERSGSQMRPSRDCVDG